MRPRAGLRRLGAVVAVLLVVLLPLAADAAVLKRGSRGDEVVTLQKKLKQWGYYDGSVDGVFGAGTEKAVQYFQRKNGLARRRRCSTSSGRTASRRTVSWAPRPRRPWA